MKKIILSTIVLASLWVINTSCEKAKDTDKAKDVEEVVEDIKEDKVLDTDLSKVVELHLSSDDAMKFDKTELRVKEGQKVTLTLVHTGKIAKDLMGHNFVLLEQGTDLAKFAEKTMAAKETDYIPSEGVIAHTGLIGGGETTTITFVAPAKGTYDFICSFPGHYGVMKGKFIVE
ncbi:MAG: azurin [Flavobacteriaceae bacterium]|nr:azurin [Flavobacteriaceae bacterium]